MRTLRAHRSEEKACKPAVSARPDDQQLSICGALDEDVGRLAMLDVRLRLDSGRACSVCSCFRNLLGNFPERGLNGLVERRSEANAAEYGRRHMPCRDEVEAAPAKLCLLDGPVECALGVLGAVDPDDDRATSGCVHDSSFLSATSLDSSGIA